MTSRPILFSAPMIRALLAGTKTQTRRMLKRVQVRSAGVPDPEWRSVDTFCPYGRRGDQLWVRETWAAPHSCDWLKPSEIDCDWRIHYAATEERGGLLWRPSIHMPRWMSRITLNITDVLVQRLHDITEADAIAEGIERVGGDASCTPWKNYGLKPGDPFAMNFSCAKASYISLWRSINGPDSWDANPWVWRVSFDPLQSTTSTGAEHG